MIVILCDSFIVLCSRRLLIIREMAVKEVSHVFLNRSFISRDFEHEKMEASKSFSFIKLMVPVHSNNLKIERKCKSNT